MKLFNKAEYHITSISKFLEIKHDLLYDSPMDPGRWFFRGECDFTYQLKPSIGRLLNCGPFTSKEELLKFERSAFSEFQISSYSELRVSDQFMLLAVAQHHGLKTRLLDWTLSPLIALFFAVENVSTHDLCGSLIAFQANFSFNTYNRLFTPFDEKLEEYEFLSMPALSPRIRAQKGVFQLFKDPTQELTEGNNLGKFVIPATRKTIIKRELAELGISYQTVFPDLDGLCKDINYYKLNDKL